MSFLLCFLLLLCFPPYIYMHVYFGPCISLVYNARVLIIALNLQNKLCSFDFLEKTKKLNHIRYIGLFFIDA